MFVLLMGCSARLITSCFLKKLCQLQLQTVCGTGSWALPCGEVRRAGRQWLLLPIEVLLGESLGFVPAQTQGSLSLKFIVLVFLLSRIFLLPGLFWSDTQDCVSPFVLSCLFLCLTTPHPVPLAIPGLPHGPS